MMEGYLESEMLVYPCFSSRSLTCSICCWCLSRPRVYYVRKHTCLSKPAWNGLMGKKTKCSVRHFYLFIHAEGICYREWRTFLRQSQNQVIMWTRTQKSISVSITISIYSLDWWTSSPCIPFIRTMPTSRKSVIKNWLRECCGQVQSGDMQWIFLSPW